MSAADSINELYQKHAPRWFKVIRWREWGNRFIKNQKEACMFFYLPGIVLFVFNQQNLMAYMMVVEHPTNEEELEAMRRKYDRNVFQRNWERGQYRINYPPLYDMWERRQKYPEYYAGRYDGFKRDGDAVYKKSQSAY